MRKVLLAAVTALSLAGLYGCASDCEISCDKSVECIPETDRETCISECDKVVEENPDCSSQFSDCASCTDGASCDELLSDEPPCATECDFSGCAAAAE
jgi:hypothetical protein